MNVYDLYKGIWIVGIYIATILGFIFTIKFGWEFSTRTEMSNYLATLLGLIFGYWLVSKTIAMTIREVDGNNALLTVNKLSPRKLETGQTLFNVYRAGFHFVWWWETDDTTIDLETDIAKAFKFTVSTTNDDMTVTAQYDVEPDPDNLSVYVLNGKDDKEREKNIVVRLTTSLQRSLESYLSRYSSEDIIQNTNNIIETPDGENRLQGHLHTVLEAESFDLGIRINKVRIGDIDFSETVSEARNDLKTVKKRLEAAKLLMSKKDGLGVDGTEAWKNVQVETGKATKVIFDISAPEGFSGLYLGEGMGVMGAGSKPKTTKGGRK